MIGEVSGVLVDRRALRLDPDDRAGQSSGGVEKLLSLRLARLVHDRPEQLADEREGEIPLELGAAGREHSQAGALCGLAGGRQKPGLADPGRALDDD